MSDLIRRLRQRAHLPEFLICAEAAAALEAAERERDEANRRYKALKRKRGAGTSAVAPSV
jgi:hypothetical protein